MAGYKTSEMTVKSNNVLRGQSFARKDRLQNNHLRLVESLIELDHWADFLNTTRTVISMITDGSAAMYTKHFYRQVDILSRHTRNIKGMLHFITHLRDQDGIDLIADTLQLAPLQVVSLLAMLKAVEGFNATKTNMRYWRRQHVAAGTQQFINSSNGSPELDNYYHKLRHTTGKKFADWTAKHKEANKLLCTNCKRFYSAIGKVSAVAHDAHIKPVKMNAWRK